MITKVYIKKPENISDKEIREIFKEMKIKVRVTNNQIQVHTTTLNDNGIFCLGMRFYKCLTIKRLSNEKI